jgi:hypothetical protein
VLLVDSWLILVRRYLCGTSNTYLQSGKSRNGLLAYVDSDYTDDLDKWRSLTFSQLVVVLLARKEVCRLLLLCLILKLNIWLFFKLVKKIFG